MTDLEVMGLGVMVVLSCGAMAGVTATIIIAEVRHKARMLEMDNRILRERLERAALDAEAAAKGPMR